MKRTGIIFLALMLASFALSGCKAKDEGVKVDRKTFPDADLYIAAIEKDLDHDNKLSQSEIENATSIFLNRAKDLTGLDVFTNLETISIRDREIIKCDFNHFTNLRTLSIEGSCESDQLDLSGNTKLEKIDINSKNLKKLVLPEGAPLKEISIESTSLEGIDLNGYKGLQKIKIDGNEVIEGLILGNLTELTELTCSSNATLYTLDVINCPKLKVFECASNALSDLNISGCENIEELKCDDNRSLTSLDLSAFPKLTELDCSRNYITELDLSCCPELTKLVCVYNSLTSLDISKGPELVGLVNAVNPDESKDGKSVYYHDEKIGHLSVDKGIDLRYS